MQCCHIFLPENLHLAFQKSEKSADLLPKSAENLQFLEHFFQILPMPFTFMALLCANFFQNSDEFSKKIQKVNFLLKNFQGDFWQGK